MTKHSISSCNTPPDADEMNNLLGEYYALMLARVEEMGGKAPAGGAPGLQEFWDHIDDYLPPMGRLFIASDDTGQFVGCGSVKQIGDGKGELKRFSVRPVARGTGLGRRLVELCIESAREMGLSVLFADTLAANVEMRGLFAKLGFSEIELYPECATNQMSPAFLPLLRFYKLELGQAGA